MIVQEALKRCWAMDYNPGWTFYYPTDGEDTIISLMIQDIFGGEILKTHKKKGWHFYNRINGERIDFTGTSNNKVWINHPFEDIPSSPVETKNYFEKEDYLTFLRRFVKTFEEIVGSEKYRSVAKA